MNINPRLQTNQKNNKTNNLYILTEPLNISNKLIIDIKDIMDFCFCNRYYDYKYDGTNNNKINFKELYDVSLHKTFYMYLRALQKDKLENTLELLKYTWGKEWIKFKKTKEIMLMNSYYKVNKSSYIADTYEERRKKGIDAIFNFNEVMAKDKQFPIIIGHKYEIEILPNIILTGNIEYVREYTDQNNNKSIQLMKFISEPTKRYTGDMVYKYSLDLIASSYALKTLFNVKDFQSIAFTVSDKKVYPNIFSDKEYNILKDTVKNVVTCIQNNIRYISPDNKCMFCEYKEICTKNL